MSDAKRRAQLLEGVATRLRVALAWRRMSQRDLASATGIPQPTLATYLSGRVVMPVTALAEISRAIGVDPTWLLLGELARAGVKERRPEDPASGFAGSLRFRPEAPEGGAICAIPLPRTTSAGDGA